MSRELKAHRLAREIKELGQQLHEHQEKCKHIKATKIPKANTGNWCPQDDSYWYECRCPTCLKYWHEDQ